MNRMHFVKVRFDRRRAGIDQDWLDARYLFFARHTLPSLTRQTCQDWRLWISCQDGMQDNVALLRSLVPYGTVFSFGDGPLTEADVPFTDDWQRLTAADRVYVTRIDSDDLYSPDALDIVQSYRPGQVRETEALMFRRGYKYDVRTGQTGVYHNPSSPFHTLIIPGEQFLDAEKYRAIWSVLGDHSKVNDACQTRVLPDWKFTVLTHDRNFLSTMDYGSEPETWVPKGFSPDQFLDQPVVFDVDDFCDQYNCLPELLELKSVYSRFCCTLFTIPLRTSAELLTEVKKYPWIELAVHGFTHEPNAELATWTRKEVLEGLRKIDDRTYVKGFKPPAWFLTLSTIQACNDAGLWLAIHKRDRHQYGPMCQHGYYVCEDRLPAWHGHAHQVCNNWIREHLYFLKQAWPKDKAFAKVSEAVLVPQRKP